MERQLLQGADAVHFTSLAEQEGAADLGVVVKGVVIPLAVEPEEFAIPQPAKSADRNFNLLFLSRIDQKKNLEGLIEAISRLGNDGPSVGLTIAGDGDGSYVAGLKATAQRAGVARRLRWIGHVEGSAKAAAFAEADAFVLASHDENFGLAAAEALAAGLPVIVSSRVAIAREVECAGAGLITGVDPDSIADAIRCLSADGAARLAMAAAARRLAGEAFSLEAMGERLEALYRTIIAGRLEERRKCA